MEPTRITVDEAKERIDRGEPLLFLDTRNPAAWHNSNVRLRGAIRVPVDEAQDYLGELPTGRTIVTYCTCPNEASSAKLAKTLLDHGFKNVHPLYGGLDAWQAAGYPVEPKETGRGVVLSN